MTTPADKLSATGFGLIIIGNEILDGRRTDAHFPAFRNLLKSRHLQLHYSLVIADDADMITQQLRWAMAQPYPFFCCGGIGATPDDKTRQCAAAAAAVGLAFHPEGLDLLEARFGSDISCDRRRLVEFPEGARIIPNPVNQIPGFAIQNGYFVPGFPKMAAGMMAHVLEQWYNPAPRRTSMTLHLEGTPESELVPVMREFERKHPHLALSSLPLEAGGKREIHLGLSGVATEVEQCIADLEALLRSAGVTFRRSQVGKQG